MSLERLQDAEAFAATAKDWPGADRDALPAGWQGCVWREASVLKGRISFGRHDGLVGAEADTGFFGHFEAATAEIAKELLAAAETALRELGCKRVLGPLNGSTWKRYRWALPGGSGEAAFLGEPQNLGDYTAWAEAAAYRVAERYETRDFALAEDFDLIGTLPRRVQERWLPTLRPLRLERFEEELRALYLLSSGSFAQARFYSPVDEESFVRSYLPMAAFLDPEMVLLSEVEGRLQGYVLAYPDPSVPGRAILKTLAVRPELRGRGLGHALAAQVQATARKKGVKRMLHALMHAANDSGRLSARFESRLHREYALMGKAL